MCYTSEFAMPKSQPGSLCSSSTSSFHDSSSSDGFFAPERPTLRKRASIGETPLNNSFNEPLTYDVKAPRRRSCELGHFKSLPRRSNSLPILPLTNKETTVSKQASRLHSILSLFTLFTFSGAIAYAGFQSKVNEIEAQILALSRNREQLLEEHSLTSKELAKTQQFYAEISSDYEHAVKANTGMKNQIKAMREEMDADVEEMKAFSKVKSVEMKAARLEGRWNQITHPIQERDRLEVIEQFGPGPHFVELELELPGADSPQFMKIEMAPLDYMPHSVHTFLSQISQQLWDGKAFDYHPGHVLMANPEHQPANEPNGESVDLSDAPVVLFPEYHEEFLHKKYTIGFPGRVTSGPGFYINLDDNSYDHSPHVGYNGDNIEGEPCFGTIVQGQEVVDAMEKSPKDQYGHLNQPVVISRARIL